MPQIEQTPKQKQGEKPGQPGQKFGQQDRETNNKDRSRQQGEGEKQGSFKRDER